MLFNKIRSAIAVSFAALSVVNGLNILITNDDGFGTSNIRAMYRAIKALGHNVYIVAPASNQSGTGGIVLFSQTRNLTADSEFGLIPKGSPSIGKDPHDDHIWYFAGTPSACIQVALDYVLPRFANFSTPDLVISGPNFGWNTGTFLFTFSGTVGATYGAVARNIPAIAFSGNNLIVNSYTEINTTTPAGLKDPATIYGELAANFAQQLINNTKKGEPLLPPGYGINVNLATITSYTNDSCIDPSFVNTRLTGGGQVYTALYNETTGLFGYNPIVTKGANVCINGDCSLPGETDLVNNGKCQSSVSIFTNDYDAPSASGHPRHPRHPIHDVRAKLMPLVQYAHSPFLVGGLSGSPWAGKKSTSKSSH